MTPTSSPAGEALLIRAVDVLADMGGTPLLRVIYSAMKKYMEPVTAEGVRRNATAIGRVADHAADRGCRSRSRSSTATRRTC